ncbi:MAG: DinB family protein [Gemmatimonadota bacterium]|nr:DinB family protein [Gemmatimonadota bacterium]
MLRSLAGLVARDLRALRREVEAYPTDESLWLAAPGAPNPGGALVRHLCGNLQHFIGAVLGESAYQRNREAEFRGPPVSRTALLAEIDRTSEAVQTAIARLTEAQLATPYPQALAASRFDTGDFLLHLTTHLAYHLGQVDYHRRLLAGSAATVNAMAIPELASATPA